MLTTYFKNLVADNVWHTMNDAATNFPGTYYLALSSTEPKEDGSGVTEPTGAPSYTRQPLGPMTAAEAGVTTNDSSISWSRFDTDQGVIGYWALYDSLNGGHLLMGGALDSAKRLDADTTIVFKPNSLTLSVLGV